MNGTRTVSADATENHYLLNRRSLMKSLQLLLIAILAAALLFTGCSEDESTNPSDNGDNIPVISSINPDSGSIDDEVTINGTDFDSSQGTSIVTFNGIDAIKYTSWCDTEIKVKVPLGAASGKVWVKVGGEKSNEVDFTVKTNDPGDFEMVLIPAGSFEMGNTGAYLGDIDEKPVHTITISRDFLMSKYEVTQKQYEEVIGSNPSYFKGENLPVEIVTWYDAVEFCNRLSDMEDLDRCYSGSGSNIVCDWDANGYRLPTEAEWEYACKAGTETDFYNGALTNPIYTPLDANLDKIGWYGGNSGSSTHNVGQKESNIFGLYDMSGNVWEWCWDWYDGNYYAISSSTDPKGALNGPGGRILRGGSLHYYASYCRSARRFYNRPDDLLTPELGFRLARNY